MTIPVPASTTAMSPRKAWITLLTNPEYVASEPPSKVGVSARRVRWLIAITSHIGNVSHPRVGLGLPLDHHGDRYSTSMGEEGTDTPRSTDHRRAPSHARRGPALGLRPHFLAIQRCVDENAGIRSDRV